MIPVALFLIFMIGVSSAEPSCYDSIKNGNETDVDCGGYCPPCKNDKSCLVNSDCLSGYCNPTKICTYAQLLWDKEGVLIAGKREINGKNLTPKGPLIIADGKGGAFIDWVYDQCSGGYCLVREDLYIQRVDHKGETKWGENGTLISKDVNGGALLMTSDGNGGVILTWSDYKDGRKIFIRRMDSEGQFLWENDTVLAIVDGDPAGIISDGKDGAIILVNLGYPSSLLKIQHIDGNGNIEWAPNGIYIIDPAVLALPNDWTDPPYLMVSDNNGGAFIAWEDMRNNGTMYGIYVQHINANGEAQWISNGVPVKNVTPTNFSFGLAGIDNDGNGGVFIAWLEEKDQYDGKSPLYIQHLNKDGRTTWGENAILIETNVTSARIVGTQSNAVIVWQSYDNRIYVQKINLDGTFQWNNATLISLNGYNIHVVPDSFGGVIITWGISQYPYSIYSQKLDGEGKSQWGGGIMVNQYGGGFKAVNSDDLDGALIGWLSNYSIHAQRVNDVLSMCYDEVKNQDETDIDCGGSCLSCEDGKNCLVDSDCLSNDCVNNVCIPNYPPNPPANLSQFKIDLTTEIPINSTTNERMVFFKGDISDPDGDKIKLQIELRPIEDNFVQRFTQQTTLVNISKISIATYGLTNGNYHWQARTVDEHGFSSRWVSFGNNSELDVDFSVIVNYLPVARFTYSPKYPELGKEITFNSSSSYDPDGGTISYKWDFGDNSNAEGAQVTHTYPKTGYYSVSLNVTDDEGTKSKYSVTLGVFSEGLEDSIEEIVNNTNNLLRDAHKSALDAAIVTDYFNEELSKDENEAVIGLIFASIDFFLPEVKKVSALSIADEVKLAEVSEELVRLISDEGWVNAEGMKSILSDAMQAVTIDIKNRLETNNFDYFNTFKDDLQMKKQNKTESLINLKNQLLANLSYLTQEEINLYKDDIRKRTQGNLLLRDIYSNKVLLPTTIRDIEIEEGLDWRMVLGKISLKIGLGAGSIALGGLGAPSLFIISMGGLGKLSGILEDIAKLDTDSQMLMSGAETLFDGFTAMDYMSRNAFQALRNIKERVIPSIPDGEITKIENFAEGPFYGKKVFYDKPPFMAEKLYTAVEIRNNGNFKATYELSALSFRPFSTGLAAYNLPFILGTERVEIEPGQSNTLIIWYKNGYLEGFKPKDQCIYFNLLGETNGAYQLDLKSTCFGTTKLVTNGVNVSEEELEEAQIFSYPVSSEISNPSGDNYTLSIYINNPFDFQVKANLTQEIPLNLDAIGMWNNTSNKTNISFGLELEAGERKYINMTTKPKKKVGIIEISGAMLKIYDQINDDWIKFQSNNLNISAYGVLNISLNQGWNLISIPLNLITNSTNYLLNNTNSTIYGYKNNSWFMPTEINNKLGYWVKVNESKNITLIGTEVEDKIISLDEGWNLINYPYLTETDINNSSLNNYTIFTYINDSWLSYTPNRINPLNTLKGLIPGYGYWAKTK